MKFKSKFLILISAFAMFSGLNAQDISFSIPGTMSSYRPGSDALYIVSVDGDNADQVNKMEFYQNEVKIGEDLSAPFEHTITDLQAGYYQIQAIAFDAGGTILDTILSELFVGTTKIPDCILMNNITAEAVILVNHYDFIYESAVISLCSSNNVRYHLLGEIKYTIFTALAI